MRKAFFIFQFALDQHHTRVSFIPKKAMKVTTAAQISVFSYLFIVNLSYL
jgi:hypothetical protein